MLLAKPEVPVFKTEFDLTDFCGFDLGVIPLEISLETCLGEALAEEAGGPTRMHLSGGQISGHR